MNKIVYHGSSNGEIKELLPHKSTHQVECIYATDDPVVSLLFMSKGRGDLDHNIGCEDGMLMLVERREGIIEEEYKNVSGYLYELDGSTFEHCDFLWSKEVISYAPSIKPINKTYIADIYSELLKEEEKGNIKIYRYPDRPEYIPLDNSDLIEKYIKYEKRGIRGSIKRLLEIYPEFTPIVQEKLAEEISEQGYIENESKSL